VKDTRRHGAGRLGLGVFALALLALPLAGCTTFFAGDSSFGDNKLLAADLPEVPTNTADGALTEARKHFRNSDFGYSAALYKRVVELSPNDPEGYVGLAASYDRLGRFDLADRVYASLYQITGGTVQYYNNIGYSYMLRGNLTAALTSFRKAERLDPENPVIAANIRMLAAPTAASG